MRSVLLSSAVLILVGIQLCEGMQESACICPVDYKKLDCRPDSRKPSERVLKNLILSGRDPTSPVFDSTLRIDWKNYKYYIDRFICACAETALKGGYVYFGMEFWGECWADNTLAKKEESATCFNGHFKECKRRHSRKHKGNKHCTGEAKSIQLYKIAHPKCKQRYERVGCFKDKIKARTLPKLMFNDRLPTGPGIPWENYDVYLPELACRCAVQSVAAGNVFFAIQFYGECWSGKSETLKFYSYGVGQKCIDRCYSECEKYDRVCAGEGRHNFVYRKATVAKDGTIVAPCPTEPSVSNQCHSGEIEGATELCNELDPSNPAFNGVLSTDEAWPNRFREFICNCAVAANIHGFSWFGVDGVGRRCFGSAALPTFNDDGSCEKSNGGACSEDDFCGGAVGGSLYIYTI